MYRAREQRDFARQLRNQPTEAEKRLGWFLKAEKLGVKFRRQAAIGAYLVDFVWFSHKLIVELDGPQHLEAAAQKHDARRTEWLESRGFQVIRFRNQELDADIRGVVGRIGKMLGPSPTLPEDGEGAGQIEWGSPRTARCASISARNVNAAGMLILGFLPNAPITLRARLSSLLSPKAHP